MAKPTLRERLCATVPTSGHIKRMGSTSYRINPDGPEAAAMLQTAAEALEGILSEIAADHLSVLEAIENIARPTLERLKQ